MCEQHRIEVHIAGICGGGAGGLRTLCSKPEHAAAAGKWRALAEKHGIGLAAVAIGVGALPACVSKVVMGMRSVARSWK